MQANSVVGLCETPGAMICRRAKQALIFRRVEQAFRPAKQLTRDGLQPLRYLSRLKLPTLRCLWRGPKSIQTDPPEFQSLYFQNIKFGIIHLTDPSDFRMIVT